MTFFASVAVSPSLLSASCLDVAFAELVAAVVVVVSVEAREEAPPFPFVSSVAVGDGSAGAASTLGWVGVDTICAQEGVGKVSFEQEV